MRVWPWSRKPVEPSPEVQAALASSEARKAHADEVLEQAELDAARMNRIIKRNGLESAVLQVFERRHA